MLDFWIPLDDYWSSNFSLCFLHIPNWFISLIKDNLYAFIGKDSIGLVKEAYIILCDDLLTFCISLMYDICFSLISSSLNHPRSWTKFLLLRSANHLITSLMRLAFNFGQTKKTYCWLSSHLELFYLNNLFFPRCKNGCI